MKVLHKSIFLEPINEDMSQLVLMWDKRGWLIGFQMKVGYMGHENYVITKDFTIHGSFIVMSMIPKLTEEDHIHPTMSEKEMIEVVSNMTTEDFKKHMTEAVTQHPIEKQFTDYINLEKHFIDQINSLLARNK